MNKPIAISSKADRDRIRGCAGGNRAMVDAVRKILREYEQGRAASACMADIRKTFGDKGAA
jgi:hypothetical protein